MAMCQSCSRNTEGDLNFCPKCDQGDTIACEVENPVERQFTPRPTYGLGVRAQVFEVIVRQAEIGASWREICAGPMEVNRITEEEVEEELRRRGGGGSSESNSPVPRVPAPSSGGAQSGFDFVPPEQRQAVVRNVARRVLEKLAQSGVEGSDVIRKAVHELDQQEREGQ